MSGIAAQLLLDVTALDNAVTHQSNDLGAMTPVCAATLAPLIQALYADQVAVAALDSDPVPPPPPPMDA